MRPSSDFVQTFQKCVLLVAGLCVAMGMNGRPAHAAEPRLVPVEAKVDFGVVPQGEKAPFEFVLRNEGDAPLRIENVKPSCGCTAALVSDDVIAPGGEARITGEVKTAGFQDRITKTITVLSNDPLQPSTTLTVTGLVDVPFLLEPRYVNFGQVTIGAGAQETAVLTVRDASKLPITFGEITVANQHVSVVVNARAAEGEAATDTFDIVVVLAADAPQGVISAPLLIPVVGEDQPLRLSLYANVVGNVALYPQTVSLGLLQSDRQVVRNFVVMSPTNTAFEVSAAVCDLPGCDVEFKPLAGAPDAAPRVRITVTVDGAQLEPGRVEGTLTVTTTAEGGSSLTARLLGSVQELAPADASL